MLANFGEIYSDQLAVLPFTLFLGTHISLWSMTTTMLWTYLFHLVQNTKLKKTYKICLEQLQARRLKPKLQRLGNESSKVMEKFMQDQGIGCELIQAHLYWCNIFEDKMKTFKNHFVTRLCSLPPNFPMQLWYKLFQQAEITLKLL